MEEQVYDEEKLFCAFESVDVEAKDELSRSKSERDTDELDSLREENMFLKKFLLRTMFSKGEDEPFACVVYHKCSLARQKEFEDMIIHLAKKSPNSEKHDEITNLENNTTLKHDVAAALGITSNDNTTHTPTGYVQYFSSYCVDTSQSSIDKVSIPSYEPVYFNTLPANIGGKIKQKWKRTCFNCDGDHQLKDCNKRRDLARISMRRREFENNKPYNSDSRYHEESTENDKYSHLKPGTISQTLRDALSMADEDLPPFIYRMRMLGYPPGWLPGNSGIVMYGKEGKEEKGKEGLENVKGMVQFPGFNVPIPKGCRDLAHEVHLPAASPRDQIVVDKKENLRQENSKRRISSDDGMSDQSHKKMKMASRMEIDEDEDDDAPPGTSSFIECHKMKLEEVEDGEILDNPNGLNNTLSLSWWLGEPLAPQMKKDKEILNPPPFPLMPLPLHKISKILPGQLNHISMDDRSRWLDPVFGNLQVRTGRFDKLKTILSSRDNKRKSL
ncbi:zinc finger CCHC domain-containing protein 8-like [Xenia sp. Carnegie-2017]|uniref:zinc finger CCHC domain-containing protein 8-like n=1 Tax=Xenia sp. Carnegie-2017 TaxID=2897299 RepID=UPI001F043F6F|nr:zinc finger CCHC domain-containing protein 8-like [Xenia sp. Carnegie-2017]